MNSGNSNLKRPPTSWWVPWFAFYHLHSPAYTLGQSESEKKNALCTASRLQIQMSLSNESGLLMAAVAVKTGCNSEYFFSFYPDNQKWGLDHKE